jgi:hypothetical protein
MHIHTLSSLKRAAWTATRRERAAKKRIIDLELELPLSCEREENSASFSVL